MTSVVQLLVYFMAIAAIANLRRFESEHRHPLSEYCYLESELYARFSSN